jgi:hypothetical protein
LLIAAKLSDDGELGRGGSRENESRQRLSREALVGLHRCFKMLVGDPDAEAGSRVKGKEAKEIKLNFFLFLVRLHLEECSPYAHDYSEAS